MSGPLFSIIVPTFRRPDRLAACLRALAALEFARDAYEIVIVDDAAGQTPLDPVVGPFRRELEVALLTQSHRGPATARNAGAAHARGRLLAFTDDDCAPAPGWLRAFAAALRDAPATLVGGRTLNALPESLCSSASQLLIDYLYSYYNAEPAHARFFTSNNLAAPAEAFRAVGGFDTSFPLAAGEDRELCARWRGLGHPMRYVPDAVVAHAHALTLRSFWAQHVNYGKGAYRLRRIHARGAAKLPRLEPASFYANLLRHPFSRGHGARAYSLAALFALSQAANATGFVWAKWRGDA
jgi:GT2 family glycosyltransferase